LVGIDTWCILLAKNKTMNPKVWFAHFKCEDGYGSILADKINSWLGANNGIIIRHIAYSTILKDNRIEYSCAIFYEAKEP
jgi:hypothetical protein